MIVKLGENLWVNSSEVRDLRLREEEYSWAVTVSLKDGARLLVGNYKNYEEGKKVLEECGEAFK